MSRTQRDIASFVVRFTQDVWEDDRGEPQVAWRGHIRHIQGEEEVRFTDFSEAVAFMQRYMKELTLGRLEALSESEERDQEQPLHESFRLWEKSATGYADMMFGAMEQSMQQSESLRKQMDSAMRDSFQAWMPSSQTASGQVLETLQALQAQVQVLAERVGNLEDALKG